MAGVEDQGMEPHAPEVVAAGVKSEDECAAPGGSCEGVRPAAAAADTMPGGEDGASPAVRLVEMPKDEIEWILAQVRAPARTLHDLDDDHPGLFPREVTEKFRHHLARLSRLTQASDDEFFAYQAWVREELGKSGRVMVPESNLAELQDFVAEEWRSALEEEGFSFADTDGEEENDVHGSRAEEPCQATQPIEGL